MASEHFDREIERIAITGNVGIVMGREVVKPAATLTPLYRQVREYCST